MRPTLYAPALLIVSALAVAAPLAAIAAASDLKISHPWSRPAAAGGNGAGYLSITNTGKAADRLMGATTPVAQRVDMHRSMEMNGMAMMHPVEGGLAIAPGATAEFAPGGYHLMLVGLKQPLTVGASFPVTLKFQKAGAVTVQFTVETGMKR
jgi:copper(I)-binding protein